MTLHFKKVWNPKNIRVGKSLIRMKKMKHIKCLMLIALAVVFASCGATAKFPVSSIAPAADITARKKTDNHNNITLQITAKSLASPDRLNPAGSNYSVWVITNDHGVKNVGQLNIKNAKKSTFKTVTPFDFSEVFITVEEQGNLLTPSGVEISRTKM
jgi:hypothetical protein